MLRSIANVLLLLIAVSDLAQADYCNIPTCQQKTQHTMCKYTLPNLGATCNKVIRVGLTPQEKLDVLKYHNNQRQLVASGAEKRGNPGPQPPAKVMPMLTWDDELATIAQRWANQCVIAHDLCRDVAGFDVGQNIGWWGETTAEITEIHLMRVLRDWYEEVQDFDSRQVVKFQEPPKGALEILHYTQMVWGKTTRLGCGSVIHTRDQSTEVYAVCNYGPSGNWYGDPVYEIRV